MKTPKVITIGGSERPIRFSFSTLLGIEIETGKTVQEVAQSGKLNDIVTILHHMLISGANKAKRTIDFDRKKVVEWLDEEDDFHSVMEVISSAMTESMPASEEGANESPGKM